MRKDNEGSLLSRRMIQDDAPSGQEREQNNTGQSKRQEPEKRRNLIDRRQDDARIEDKQQNAQRDEQSEGAKASSLTEEEIEASFEESQLKEKKMKRQETLATRIARIAIIIGCAYMVFLIFGVFVTDYYYDDTGEVYAQRMSVSDIQAKHAYQTILTQYSYCRMLYEDTLMLDYRLGEGIEDPLVIASEYEALLDDVEDLSIKTDAMSVDSQYEQIKDLMLTWIQDDIAVYLQNMSAAISTNDEETANNALQDQTRVYSDFSIITQNIVAMGDSIPGVDISDVKSWTPEDYVYDEINQ